jgi:hypothetical protein
MTVRALTSPPLRSPDETSEGRANRDVSSGRGGFATRLAQAGTSGPTRSPSSPSASHAASPLRRLFGQIVDGERRLDAALARGQGPRPLGNGELLALQVDVYRYTERLELVSRVTDRATGGLKQILQTQV